MKCCQFQRESGEEQTYGLEIIVLLKDVDGLLCPGCILPVQTGLVLMVMSFPNTSRIWGA